MAACSNVYYLELRHWVKVNGGSVRFQYNQVLLEGVNVMPETPCVCVWVCVRIKCTVFVENNSPMP